MRAAGGRRIAGPPGGRRGRPARDLPGQPRLGPESNRILFPTNESTKWLAALEWPWVAFEVDGMDADAGQGWSVAAVGRAEPVTDPDVIMWARGRRPVGWLVGPHTNWLAIAPTKLTGWRILGPPS